MTFETFYAVPGPMTDPKEYAYLLRDLLHNLATLVKVVQGLCVHIFWAERDVLRSQHVPADWAR